MPPASARRALRVSAAGWVAALVAGRALEWAAASRWRRNPDPAVGARAPEPAAGRDVVVSDGARLRVVAWGADSGATPVLLVHGITADWRDWRSVVAHLVEGGHRVLAVDLRGHGASGLGLAPPGTARLAADLREVLEALDLRDVVLVGHSLGAYSALALAAGHPDTVRARVRCLVLVGGTATMRRPHELAVLLANASPLTPWVQHHRRLGRTVMRAVAFGARPSLAAIDDIRLRWSRCPWLTRVAFAQALAGDSLVGRLGQVAVPVLAVYGTRDRVAPPRRSTLVARRVLRGTARPVEGAGHVAATERPAEVAALIGEQARPAP